MTFSARKNRRLAYGGAIVFGALTYAALGASSASDAEIAARRERVARLSDTEKEQLLARQQRFRKARRRPKGPIRALYEAIENHARRDELKTVMTAYGQWLRELTPEDRARLLATDTDKRLAVVGEFQEKLQKKALAEAQKRMKAEDAKAILAWMDEHVAAHWPATEKLLSERDQERFKKAKPEEKAAIKREMVWKWMSRDEVPSPDDAAYERLVAKLSADRQAQYRAAPEGRRRPLVASWVFEGAISPMFRGGRGPQIPMPSAEDIQAILKKLPDEERKRLEKLSADRMREELRRHWWMENRPRWFGPQGGIPGRGRPDREGRGDRENDRGRDGRNRDGPGRQEPPNNIENESLPARPPASDA